MRRVASIPRAGWQQKVEAAGLIYHTPGGVPYWDESAYYAFTAAQIERLETAAAEAQRLCLEAGQFVIDRDRFAEFGINRQWAAAITRAWNAEPPAIYGRFDFAFDGSGDPKLLEYNADTPTSLLEAAVVQWYWLQDTHPSADQWNSIHERLVAKWSELRGHIVEPLYFAAVASPEHEDEMTVSYLRDTANEAGIATAGINIDQIGFDSEQTLFVDLDGRDMRAIFKLYPWEWLTAERFSEQLLTSIESVAGVTWIEPVWKMLWSNKTILAVLWELFPNHPNLLPAFGKPAGLASYVKKPRLSREGANVTIVEGGREVAATGGSYGAEGYVFQARAPMRAIDGRHPVLGIWMIDGEPSGMGIRESDGPITGNLARFVPHLVD
jgi:glutathionylspermidine synthase